MSGVPFNEAELATIQSALNGCSLSLKWENPDVLPKALKVSAEQVVFAETLHLTPKEGEDLPAVARRMNVAVISVNTKFAYSELYAIKQYDAHGRTFYHFFYYLGDPRSEVGQHDDWLEGLDDEESEEPERFNDW